MLKAFKDDKSHLQHFNHGSLYCKHYSIKASGVHPEKSVRENQYETSAEHENIDQIN